MAGVLRRAAGLLVSRGASAGACAARGLAASSSAAAAEAAQAERAGPATVVVLGGNGFVGSAVCRALLATGALVTSVSRSGAAPAHAGDWAARVRWAAGDALEPAAWREQLPGAAAVVSCVGAFGSDAFMERVCGDATVVAVEEAAKAAVPRFVFVSAHDYELPRFILGGYYRGKHKAEAAIAAAYPEGGVWLRPAFIHGDRHVAGVTVPLSAVGGPLEQVLGTPSARKFASSLPLGGALLASPLPVDAVARAAAHAALDAAVPAGGLDVEGIRATAAAYDAALEAAARA